MVPVNPAAATAGTPMLFHLGSWFNPSWSPDGTRIAANGSDDGNSNIIAVFDAFTGAMLASFASSTPGPDPYFAPQWSPDGTHLAFSATVTVPARKGSSTNWEIFLATPDFSAVTQVTHLNSFTDFPSWSPDGTTLAFRSDFSGTMSLYKTVLGSSTVTLLHSPGNNLDWNP